MGSVHGKKIIIAGGGLGGLAAEVALLERGFQVAVFEKSSELREVGAGLSVWPNATLVLKKLGLLDEALRLGEPILRLLLNNWRGTNLLEVRAVAGCETPAICIHRAELMSVLKSRVPAESVHLGERLVEFEDNGDVATARFSSGRTIEGDALIGADGIQSTVRTLLWGESKPVYSGYQGWRGVAECVPASYPAGTAIELWGRGQRFGVERLSRNRTFWYATANAPEGSFGDRARWKDQLSKLFAGWANPVHELIEATESASILKHEIEDRRPTSRWGRGRITLLGDAAHLTTPNLGQGACMALEDALVVARSLSEGRLDTPYRLRQYESLRHRRTALLTREARRVGRIGQLENGLAVFVRDLALRLTPNVFSELRHRKYFSFSG
jgi:2-polyprenyl-6-methoxyphenol hydroxylase-like FAD-dependent oxidoreductase